RPGAWPFEPRLLRLPFRLRPVDLQQGRRLGPAAPQVEAARRQLVRPARGQVVPLAGLLLLAQLVVGHGQEKPVKAVAAPAQDQRPVQGPDGPFPVPRPVEGHAERAPVGPVLGRELTSCRASASAFSGFLTFGSAELARTPATRLTWSRTFTRPGWRR